MTASSPTLSELEPGWTEEASSPRRKTSARMQGSMKMTLQRVSRLPESSRHYMPGDPPHLIDWRVFARSDQLMLREQRDEASASIALFVDLSESMHWPRGNDYPDIPSKSEVALRVAFWLAHSHLTLGDSVDFWIKQDKDDELGHWRPRSPADVESGYLALKQSFKTSIGDAVQSLFIQKPLAQKRWNASWIVSDGLMGLNWLSAIERPGRICFLHLLSCMELNLGWMEDETCYIERTIVRRDFLGQQLKGGPQYFNRVSSWCDEIRNVIESGRGKYFRVSDETPIHQFFDIFCHESFVS